MVERNVPAKFLALNYKHKQQRWLAGIHYAAPRRYNGAASGECLFVYGIGHDEHNIISWLIRRLCSIARSEEEAGDMLFQREEMVRYVDTLGSECNSELPYCC